MSSLSYGEFCRLCLVKESVSIPIFEGEGDVRSLFFKITTCLPVKVSREDRLPKKICDDCLYKLENQYSFWNSTANAEKQLLQWYELDSLTDEKKIVPTTNLETEQLDLKQEVLDPEQGSELAKSLSRVEAVLAEESDRRTANTEEDEEEEESEEEGSNSEESEEEEDNDNDADEPSKEDNESEENYEELEPTTFVNVSLACDEAGPSGMQQQQQQQMSAPSTSTSGAAASGILQQAKPEEKCGKSELNLFLNDSGAKLVYSGPILKDGVQHKEYQHTCNKCNLKFPEKLDLVCHKRVIHHQKIINYFCDFCDFSTFHLTSITKHRRKHEKLDTLKCDICNKRGFSKFEFYKHKATHKAPFHCPVCNKPFRDFRYMKVHVNEQHDPDFEKRSNFQCEICGKAFSSRQSLRGHGQIHLNTRPTCDICGKSGFSKSYLRVHRRTHTGERPLVCPVCKKTFSAPSSFSAHRRVHDGKKPHKCKECSKSFTQRSTLIIHMRYHTGIRPYGCELCDKVFVSKTLLTTHEKIHDA